MLNYDIFIFIYNIVLLILYSVALTFSFTMFIKSRKKLFLFISFMFTLFILDNTIIYMTEFITSFSQFYDMKFMTVPAFKTIIVIGTNICYFFIQENVLRRQDKIWDYILLILLGCYLLFIPGIENSAWKVWLYYLPSQLYLFFLAVQGLHYMKKNPKKYHSKFYTPYRKLLYISITFALLILLEDSIVIFNFDQYSSLLVKINNRSLTEDFLSIIYSFYAISYFMRRTFFHEPQAVAKTCSFQEIDPILPGKVTEEKLFQEYCSTHAFTTREIEVFEKLLSNMTNEQISNDLFISIGTTKTHVHNVFKKVDVSKRSALIQHYNRYLNDQKNAV